MHNLFDLCKGNSQNEKKAEMTIMLTKFHRLISSYNPIKNKLVIMEFKLVKDDVTTEPCDQDHDPIIFNRFPNQSQPPPRGPGMVRTSLT